MFFFQNELKEVEEKFRQAMVANAGLDNEKSSLTYQVRSGFGNCNKRLSGDVLIPNCSKLLGYSLPP